MYDRIDRLCKLCISCHQMFITVKYYCGKFSVVGAMCLSLPHLTLLNLDGTKVRAEVEEKLRAQCPELSRVSLVNIDPVSAVDEETDNW